MAKIYALITDELILYVGSTICSLEKRESEHRNKGNLCGSANIPINYKWKIILIEECEIQDRFIVEQLHYEILKPLYNRNKPYNVKRESIWKKINYEYVINPIENL